MPQSKRGPPIERWTERDEPEGSEAAPPTTDDGTQKEARADPATSTSTKTSIHTDPTPGVEPGPAATTNGSPPMTKPADPLAPEPARHATAESVRAILFDLDNTLVDFIRVKLLASEACARAMIAAGADFGSPPQKVASMLFAHYLDHGIESDDAFQTFLRKYQRNRLSYTQNQIDKVLAAGINAYLRAKDMLLAPYPGVHATLVELVRRGYRLGVLTDAPRLKAWQRLHAVGIADLFDVVVTTTDVGVTKPDGRGFHAALDALQLKAHQAAMVGDWAERDVAGGNRLGLYTVLARYGADSKEGLPPPPPVAGVEPHELEPDLEAQHFSDLLDVFHGTRGQA